MPRVVIVPAAPALVPAISGSTPDLEDARQAARDVLRGMLHSMPTRVVVVADAVRRADERDRIDLSPYGVASAPDRPLPIEFVTAAWLLDDVGWTGPRVYAGADALEASGDDVVVVVADGSACRSLQAPGYHDDRAAAFDASIETALAGGHTRPLLEVDAGLASDLRMSGLAPLQWLARQAQQAPVTAEVVWSGAPLGVGTWVAAWSWDTLPGPRA